MAANEAPFEGAEGEHPAIADARELLALEEQARQLAREDPFQRAWRALMLSPTPAVWNALLRGERVPSDQLDPLWLERFGRRRG